jgi:hypothetical protein
VSYSTTLTAQDVVEEVGKLVTGKLTENDSQRGVWEISDAGPEVLAVGKINYRESVRPPRVPGPRWSSRPSLVGSTSPGYVLAERKPFRRSSFPEARRDERRLPNGRLRLRSTHASSVIFPPLS